MIFHKRFLAFVMMSFLCLNADAQSVSAERINGIFPKLNLPVTLVDSLVFENWSEPIDNNLVKRLGMNSQLYEGAYPITNIGEYQCNPIGRFGKFNFMCLVYKTYTSLAGDQNPCVMLGVYDEQFNLKYKIDLLGASQNDYLSQRTQNCCIAEDSIVVTSGTKIYKEENGRIALEKEEEYSNTIIITETGGVKRILRKKRD